MEVRGLKALQRKLRSFQRWDAWKWMLNASALVVEREAKREMPVDAGHGRRSIVHNIDPRPTPLWAKVSPGARGGGAQSPVRYLPHVEFGTRPHWSPIAPLREWARRHGMNVYALAAVIARRGTRPNPFMKRAANKASVKIRGLMDRVGKRVEKDFEVGRREW